MPFFGRYPRALQTDQSVYNRASVKAYDPDARMQRILGEAARTALAEMRVNAYARRNG